MENFLKNNKKKVKIGIIAILVILLFLILWLFIFPSFKSNKYGNRLKDEKKHVISNKVIDSVKDKSKDNESVSKISFHKEGRVINLVVTVDSNYGADQAKEFASSLLKEFDSDDLSYYDVQVLIDSNEESDNYPIIGYKSKNSDGFNFGKAGE